MIKKDIRKVFLQKRIQLTGEELQEKSVLIIQQFSDFILPSIEYLLSYYPLKERKEFDVSACEQVIKLKYPLCKVSWPKVDQNKVMMEAHVIDKDKLFIKNSFGILEPLDGDVVSATDIDIIFVPLIAFDQNGFRVGYGKGFYDKYLVHCRPDVIKIGFSFFEAIDEIEDVNEFDVPLNLCISPTRIYEF